MVAAKDNILLSGELRLICAYCRVQKSRRQGNKEGMISTLATGNQYLSPGFYWLIASAYVSGDYTALPIDFAMRKMR